MLKRTISMLSKAKAIRRLQVTHLEVAPRILTNIQNASFSTVFKTQLFQSKSLHSITRFNFASLPSHQKLAMPALSPTMEQGNIVKWNYKEGDKVSAGDAICDIETDKATLSFDVQDEGYIAKILVPDGTKGIKVGTPIVILADSEGDIQAFKDFKDESASSGGAKETKKSKETEEETTSSKGKGKEQESGSKGDKKETSKGNDKPNAPDQPEGKGKILSKGYEADHHYTESSKGAAKKTEGAEADTSVLATAQSGGGDGKTRSDKGYGGGQHHHDNFKGVPRNNVKIRFNRHGQGQGHEEGQHEGEGESQGRHGQRVAASPSARRLAKEKSIDLSQVQGSGPNGRVLRHDVEGYKPKPKQAAPATSGKEEKTEKAQDKSKAQAQAGAKSGAAPSPQYTDIPIKEERQVANKIMLESKQTIPYYYLKADVQIDDLKKVIEKLNGLAKSFITVDDLIIKAAGLACIEVPEVNSQWHGKTIRKFKNADIAMLIDTPDGFVAPVLRSANTKGLKEISSAAKLFNEKAATLSLGEDDFVGATFTISNLGSSNVTYVTSLITPPQACLLGVGTKGKKVIPDGEGFKEVTAINVTLVCDHRVVDGAVGAKWLQAFKRNLEQPLTMLL